MEFFKAFEWSDLSVNYTFLVGENEDEDRRLDLLPESQLNFVVNIFDKKKVRFTLSGFYASSAEVKIFEEIVRIPGYFVLNAVLSIRLSNYTIFLKGENLFDKYYVTEPGYPMKARTVALGFAINL